ncbi:PKD domain-containing protein [Halomicroarcula sp. F24A]|uniref:PKD domain-containing protein n=2 Tax=Haloarcula salinisoli TaxID=2487746 RepID=A0A8J7YJY1_9EURY|nr:PKD domain-containing protein [Halomicroarcula salinisoli]
MNVTVEAPARGGGGGGGGGAYTLSWADPSDYTTSEALADCSAAGCTWDVGGSSDSTLTLRAGTTPALSGFDVEFAVNDTAIGSLLPTDTSTDSNGQATTDITASENGTVGVYTASGGASDVFNLTVQNVSSGGGNGAPTASFTYSPSSPNPGESATFDASGSSDPDGDSLTYSWDWDDGSTDTTTSETISHTYSASGSYTVSLTVSDGNGASDTTTQTVTVGSQASQVSVAPNSNGTAGPDGAKIQFSLTNSGSSSVSITNISVDSTTANADYVEDRDDGTEFEGAGGSLDTRLNIGGATEPLDTDATISGTSTEQFSLGQFRRDAGVNSQTVSMSGDQVTITLTFGDGSTAQFVLSP